MKKISFTVFMCILFVSILPSCKKNYTCTCEVGTEKYIYDYSDQLKSEAEKACDAQDAAARMANPDAGCVITKD